MCRQRLHFVENDDRARDAMELSAPRRRGGKERFQELYRGRYDDWSVPVFRDKIKARFLFFIVGRQLNGRMVLQHHVVAKDAAILRCVLFDDGKVGDYYNDPTQTVV